MAFIATALHLLKPLALDDLTHYAIASWIATHPLDPYGPMANLPVPPIVPPVVPYWLSIAIRLIGDRPLLVKFSLLPFNVAFVVALHMLFRRFTPGLSRPLVVMTAFSPVFLPTMGLMLDVPALALSLLSVELFLRGAERESKGLAASAGLAAGLSILAKYTGLLAPATMLGHAVLFRRTRLWIIAAGVSGVLFGLWEMFTAVQYGDPQFLSHAQRREVSLRLVAHLFLPLLAILGTTSLAIGLLALAALRASQGVYLAAAAAALLPYALLAGLPFGTRATGVMFGMYGAVVCALAAVAIVNWCRAKTTAETADPQTPRVTRFLVLWLVLEVIGYFVLSPFPAVRRIMGMVIVATIVLGRLAWQASPAFSRMMLIRVVAPINVLLGLALFGVDLTGARGEQRVTEQAARRVRANQPNAMIWFAGHWSRYHDAARVGMQPLTARYRPCHRVAATPAPSRLRTGDWLVFQDNDALDRPVRFPDPRNAPLVEQWTDLGLRLRTFPFYHASGTPLRHGRELRTVRIYRVRADFVAEAASPFCGP